MSYFYASARSNAFKVKDQNAFQKGLAEVDGILINKIHDDLLMVYADSDIGWPTYYLSDNNEEIDFDIEEYIPPHLVDGQVAILMQVMLDNTYCVGGYAVALNNKGERRILELSKIFDLAKELGPDVTVF